jgi:hypothetical protein
VGSEYYWISRRKLSDAELAAIIVVNDRRCFVAILGRIVNLKTGEALASVALLGVTPDVFQLSDNFPSTLRAEPVVARHKHEVQNAGKYEEAEKYESYNEVATTLHFWFTRIPALRV